MHLLVEWITQIIVFLIMAAIVDLLIPASTMKKYIKLVIGLLLILVFLKPIFYIFHIDIEKSLESAYSELSSASTTDGDMESLIKKQKKDIQASKDAYIVKQLSQELTDIAKTPLKEKFNMKITGIQFIFADDRNQTYEGLEEIKVTLVEAGEGEGGVGNIEEVVINTKESEYRHDGEKSKQLEDVQTLLENTWETDNKKVTVLWEGKEP
ncbi:MAG TPA: stage III sporulation protein AF [Bacillota bacterium]|nr:stage III sporulation protein AF [Bacillota bacterium]